MSAFKMQNSNSFRDLHIPPPPTRDLPLAPTNGPTQLSASLAFLKEQLQNGHYHAQYNNNAGKIKKQKQLTYVAAVKMIKKIKKLKLI